MMTPLDAQGRSVFVEQAKEPTHCSVSCACTGCNYTEHDDRQVAAGVTCVEARAAAEEPRSCPRCKRPLKLSGFGWGDPTDPTITHSTDEIHAERARAEEQARAKKGGSKDKPSGGADPQGPNPPAGNDPGKGGE